MTKKTSPHRGSTLDAFLEEEGLIEDATAKAVKSVLAWQLAQAIAGRASPRVSRAEVPVSRQRQGRDSGGPTGTR
jgi:hypothetical protein